MQGIKRFLHDYARWIAAALAILFLGLTVYYATAQRFVASTVSMTRRHDATNLAEGDVIEQMVCFTQEDLELNQAQVQVQVGTYQNKYHTGTLTISLLDENGQTVSQISKPCSEISDKAYVGLEMTNLQPDILYTLRIELHGFEETLGVLAIWTGELLPEEELLEEENDAQEQVNSELVGIATKNGQPLMDVQDEKLYVTIRGLETELGIQRAYYPLVALAIVGAIFFLLPSKQPNKQEGETRQ